MLWGEMGDVKGLRALLLFRDNGLNRNKLSVSDAGHQHPNVLAASKQLLSAFLACSCQIYCLPLAICITSAHPLHGLSTKSLAAHMAKYTTLTGQLLKANALQSRLVTALEACVPEMLWTVRSRSLASQTNNVSQ